MASRMPDVLVTPVAFQALCASAIETYGKECCGMLLGNTGLATVKGRRRRFLRVCGAFPQQTAKRSPDWVKDGNERAARRYRATLRTLSGLRDVRIVGGYHSHPEAECKLSEDDYGAIANEVEMMNGHGKRLYRNSWLEMIIAIGKKEYVMDYEAETYWHMNEHKRKASVLIQTTPDTAYRITLGAFWVIDVTDIDGDRFEYDLEEAKVRVRW